MEIIEDAAGIRGREIIPRVIFPTAPSAGAEFSFTVPGGIVWRVKSLVAVFGTSAAVANRVPAIKVLDSSGQRLCTVASADVQAASIAGTYSWVETVTSSYSTAATQKVAPFPIKTLLPGWTVGSVTANIDVGDTWSGLILYVYEIWERPLDTELGYDLAKLRGSQSNALPLLGEDW